MKKKQLYIISEINNEIGFIEGCVESVIIKFQETENANKYYQIEINNSITHETYNLIKICSLKPHTKDQINSLFKYLITSRTVCKYQ